MFAGLSQHHMRAFRHAAVSGKIREMLGSDFSRADETG